MGGASNGGPASEEPGLFEVPATPAPTAPAGAGKPGAALGAPVPAARLPVARVLLETPLPQLDRPFDYLVTRELDADAQPGVRVKVHFGGRRLTGFLVERVAEPEPGVRPLPLTAVVSPERVLSPAVLALCRDVAARYAGLVGDVVRAAVPPRVAKVEKEDPAWLGPLAPAPAPTNVGPWSLETGGPEFVEALATGRSPRAVVSVTPDGGGGWARRLALAAAATAASHRGSVLVVPDQRDLDRLCAALDEVSGPESYARLTAEDGPTKRYRAFLSVARGRVSIAVGTRSAAFAPVPNLGLVAMWDDHDFSHVEPRAPYQHAREVLLLRATEEGAAAVFASPARSAEAERLVRTGWAQDISADRGTLRANTPWVRATADARETSRDPLAQAARVPHLAWESAKAALTRGPVLVQVARTGFLPSLRCETCREPARCSACQGPLALAGSQQAPVCRWCGRYERAFRCPHCNGTRLRAGRVGADRTAEELGRAFPGVPVVRATGADGVRNVPDEPALVISTPGAEPVADGGYAGVLLLDADAQLAPEGLRAGEDALHRWLAAASLARPRDKGGVVVLTGHPSTQGQALVRWDPAGAAERELRERAEVGLPPAVRFATVLGPAQTADDFVADLREAAPLRVVGPTPGDEPGDHRWILFFTHADGPRVTELLRRRRQLGSLRRDPVLRLKVDEPDAL